VFTVFFGIDNGIKSGKASHRSYGSKKIEYKYHFSKRKYDTEIDTSTIKNLKHILIEGKHVGHQTHSDSSKVSIHRSKPKPIFLSQEKETAIR